MDKSKLFFFAIALSIGINCTAQNVLSPCPQVLIEQKYDHISSPEYWLQGWDTVVTCANPELTLTADPYIPVQYFNGTYTVEEIPYNPPDTSFYLDGEGFMMSINSDDQFAPDPVNIPFPFYFFGIQKTHFYVGDNGLISFTNNFGSGEFCPWSFSAGLPWTPTTVGAPCGDNDASFNRMHDAVYGIYQDIYTGPNGSYLSGNQGIYYGVVDEYPCRKIICSWNDIPYFNNQPGRNTYQIVCYEGSNIIEVHVKKRHTNTSWLGGRGIIGIQNATGLPQVRDSIITSPLPSNYYVQTGSPAAFFPADCNPTTSDFDSVSYRFTPQGVTAKMQHWYRIFDDGRDSVELLVYNQEGATDDTNGYYIPMGFDSHHPTLTQAVVHPTCVSRYVMELKFQTADGNWFFLYDTITIGVGNEYITISDNITGVHDTTYIKLPATGYDTTGYEVHDTTYVLINNDTIAAADSLSLTECDTIISHYMMVIHDTIFSVSEGISDIAEQNAIIYQHNGQIAVEGAMNNTVTLYDATGRIQTIKQSNNQTITFDIPSSGVYLVKVGDAPARRIVVVR